MIQYHFVVHKSHTLWPWGEKPNHLNHSKAIKRNTLQVSANKEYRKTEQLLVLSHTPQVKVDGPGRRRPKEDKDYWLEGESRG